MTIRIYNTKTGKKEPLQTIKDGIVNLYVCGITAYDYCHLGHARSTIVFDMIVKYLRHRDYTVNFVRNFTDIDDKIINRAAEQNTTPTELSTRFIQAFHEDMKSLGNITPDIEPLATDHIPEIVSLIETLIDKEMAYESAGDVYYRVNKFRNYGQLSGRNLEDMQAGARIAINDQKENPMDFALWKTSKPGEPMWDSPWGEGRPGWHIECSAMAKKYFGDTFDIHGGGKDLIFPHHENEIAQSEGASGEIFVNTWIHHGFVTIKDEKMSKSLGNFLTIREMLKQYSAETLRLFIFSAGYRTPLDFSDQAMKDAEAGVDKIYASLATVAALDKNDPNNKTVIGKKDHLKFSKLSVRLQAAMDNDFNTAQAMGYIFDSIKTINKICSSHPQPLHPDTLQTLTKGAETITTFMNILGLITQAPRQYMKDKQSALLATLTITPEEIEELITKRNQARADKDWSKADEIRDILLEHNVEMKDGVEGTTWVVR